MGDAIGRYRASYRVLFATLWLTLLVLAVKLWASWTTRSLSLLADFLHTLLDCFSIGLSIVSTAMLRQVPIGSELQDLRTHRKRHTAAVLLLTAFLGFVGFTLLALSTFFVQQFWADPTQLPPLEVDLALVVLLAIVSAVQVCWVLFERYESRVLGNPTLRHNANHVLQDCWLTLLLLASLVGISQGYRWIDPLTTIILTLMLVPSFWQMLDRQLPSLMNQMAIAPESLIQLASKIEGVADCDRIRSQGILGQQLFIQMYLRLRPEFMGMAHLIGERLEGLLRDRYGAVSAKIYVKDTTGKLQRWQDALSLAQKKQRKPKH
jgi:cation diffusion facilitator family transporter